MQRELIKDLAEQIRGVSYKPEDLHKDLNEDSVILLRANNIDNGMINFDDVVYVDKSKVSQDQYLKTGDILICASSGSKQLVGKAASIEFDKPCTFGAFCKVVRPRNGWEKYLGAFFQSDIYRQRISALSIGANINNIRNEHIDSLVIPLHTEELRKSAIKEIDLLNRIIRKRKTMLQSLDLLIKARFVEMFGSVEKKIPLSTLCDVSGGYSFKSGDITSDGAVKILQIGNVYLDDISWETTNYLPKGYDETYSRFLLNKGDIVVALTRPIIQSLGNVKACIVRDLDLPCLLNQRVGRIVPRNNREVSNQFIYGCLMTCDFTRYVKSCCIGCSQPNISSNDIGNYMIPDVSFNEQMMFVNFKEQIDKSKVVVPSKIKNAIFAIMLSVSFGQITSI